MVVALLVVALVVIVAVVNLAFYAPALRRGYRPWKEPPWAVAVPARVAAPHSTITGRIVAGWSPRNPPRFELTVNDQGALVTGAGPRVWIPRAVAPTVRCLRWWFQDCFLFVADDERFAAMVFFPDQLDEALERLLELGWSVDRPVHGDPPRGVEPGHR